DNDGIYGNGVRAFLESCGIEEVRTAYRSPWLAKSAQKRARKSAQMGATWIINSSVYCDAVNKFLLPHP
ncbi:MAG: hypothetical protein KAS19_05455, partial [Anaerolineales bacterium]|nr:hypothetical protein [Anaerolineales bacterium]